MPSLSDPQPPPLTGAARAFSATYFLGQGVAIGAFWLAMWVLPAIRPSFILPGAPAASFLSLVLADAGLLLITSFAAAWSVLSPGRRTIPLLWLHAGAALYAGLYAVGLWLFDPRLWLGAGLMLPVLATPLTVAVAASRPPGANTVARALFKTAIQIAFFWSFFLIVLPAAILLAERALGVPPWPAWAAQRPAATGLFLVGGSIGLASAWCMATAGCGTPLPTDPACRLVIAGPYRFVRNPMAIGGLLQGLAVAVWCSSWTLIAYSLMGAVVWQFGPRIAEERELEERFGEPYRAYRREVRCWRPRLRAYIPRGNPTA